ncbi:helicase-exonuclease AddAB subunit AddB [Paenibacillus sp. NPDC058071]|uniref:helicase-exonuclease AddAB subunit AddB n=1 Tax=Paenibacillus sp. NPDC058071 TaxID=3346326 RepID=UPI0036D8868D
MPLTFVLGRSGSGKTTYCLDRIRERLQERPDGPPLLMLVPEQATFQTEYALLKDSGLNGSIRAQAISFRRLAFRVMQETGGTALVPISDDGKHMLLYKIMNRLDSQLELFRSGAEQPGFIEKLSELLTEWKRYGIDAERTAEAAQANGADDAKLTGLLGRKLRDLQLIYSQLEGELTGLYIDSEDYLSRLAQGFAEAPSMKGAEIWIDGFYGFTPKEYEALSVLLSSAANVTIALTLDRMYSEGERPHELELFHPTAETCAKLSELATAAGIDVHMPVLLSTEVERPEGATAGRFSSSPMLAHLERHYGMRVPMLPGSGNAQANGDASVSEGISLHAAANRRAEVEAVARDMSRRVREEGLRWRDMAVMVRNAADYTDYIEAVLGDYGIPYFLDQKSPAVHHPLVEFIRSALETVLHGWKYEAVFRCIKTELLFPIDGSMPREQYDLLENYVLAGGIDGWKWLDAKRWRPLVPQSLEDDNVTMAEPSARALRELEAVLAARETIVPPLRRFGDALQKAPNVKAMCEALYRLLDHSDAADRLERWSRRDLEDGKLQRSRSHRQLWDSVMNLLDQLVEMVGDEAMPPAMFAGMVETGLEGMKLAAVPPSLDQALIGSMDRTRSGAVRVCYVLGANDGIMPGRIQEDGVLTEQERERLAEEGLSMAPGVRRRLLDERFMIYNALTTPSEHLWISWAQADEEGKSLLPSEVIRQIRRLFPFLSISEVAAEPSPNMPSVEQREYIEHPERTISYLITELRSWRQGSDIAGFWWDLYNWYAIRPEWQDKLALLVSSLGYVNQVPLLTIGTAQKLYGVHLKASVSRMERFVSCPFQHFVIHGLKLKERKMYRLEAPDVGQLYHAALSKLAGGLGQRWGRMPESEIREEAARVVDELAPRLQSQILLSSGRFQYIARKLKEVVAQAAAILGEHARRADFQPVGLEVDFGPGGSLPSLIIPLQDGGLMEIIGRIDRVDAAETEQGLLLRVLDYKSSATQIRLEEVAYGLSLQMLTYLDVLVTHATAWLGRPASPAGVLYFHVHNPLMAVSNGLPAAETNARLMKRFKMKGLVTADADTVKRMDGLLETGYSELLPVALKRDGGFYSSSSVVTPEQWEVLRGSVRRTIGRIGEEIRCGNVSIEPYRLGAKSPCQYCDYKPVCQFDPLFEGNAYHTLRKPAEDELWRQLEGKGEEADDGND